MYKNLKEGDEGGLTEKVTTHKDLKENGRKLCRKSKCKGPEVGSLISYISFLS